ncbi:MAG: hypothetical protein QM831_05390 [Kofleriaceae bacterium]
MNADEDLRAQLAAVKAELGALRAQLDALTTTRGLTMAGQIRCPSCGGRKLLVTTVLDRDHGGGRTLAIAHKGMFRDRSIGELQIHICRTCGLVEWHVPDLSEVVVDGENVRELDGSADPESPYR